MTAAPPSPLGTPLAWDLVAADYVTETAPLLARFAVDALRLAPPPPGGRVLDVATGPGTLALLVAPRVAQVDAIDFAPAMVARLGERLAAGGVANVTPRVGDGQALPYDDRSFDAAYSMFGLMFFPDRIQGLRELARVLVPGGCVAISSWQPPDPEGPFGTLFGALRASLPGLPFGEATAPLGAREEVHAELTAGGFVDVTVHEAVHDFEYESAAAMWASFARSLAPLVLLRRNLGEDRWVDLAATLEARLAERCGAGRQRLPMRAWIGTGRVATGGGAVG